LIVNKLLHNTVIWRIHR